MKILLVDNFDSFTYNLEHYLLLAGLEVITLRNTAVPTSQKLEDLQIDGYVFSPGPMRPEDHPGMMKLLSQIIHTKPILGICLGMQAIGLLNGCELIHAPLPVHGKTSMIHHNEASLFENIPQLCQVMRYHSLVLKGVQGTPLEVTANTVDDQLIMGVQHKNLPLFGLQFHPESILTPSGQAIINNWANLVRKR